MWAFKNSKNQISYDELLVEKRMKEGKSMLCESLCTAYDKCAPQCMRDNEFKKK